MRYNIGTFTMTRLITTVLLLCVVVASAATPTTSPAWAKVRPLENRVISLYSIGWSTDDPSTHNIAWGLPETGWPAFVETWIKPQVAWGIRRFQLHNPFGTVAGGDMQFTQLLHAKLNSKLDKVTDIEAFIAAWKPITDSGVEVIAYIGAPVNPSQKSGDRIYNDPIYARSKKAIRDAVLQPFIDAGMSVALDVAAAAKADSDTYLMMKELRAKGIRVYIEPLPNKTDTHLHSYPSEATEWFYYHPDLFNWNVYESLDETITLFVDNSDNYPAEIQKRLAEGEHRTITVGGLGIKSMMEKGITIQQAVGSN